MPKSNKTLKVIGGIYKGRNLQMAPLEVTRSSKAILKESLFNTLNVGIVGAYFVEFFAGSGSIGIEALSRRAEFAVFCEQNNKSFAVLESNLKSLCDSKKYHLIFGDTFALYPSILEFVKSPCIGYIDPPFSIRKNMQNIYQQCFMMIENLDNAVFKLIILEHETNLEIPKSIGAFTHLKTKCFGKSALSYFG